MNRFFIDSCQKTPKPDFSEEIWSHDLTRGLLGHVAPPKQPALWRTRRRRRSTRRGAATARPAARRRSGHKAPAARGCREQRLRPLQPSSRGLAGAAATRWRSGRGGRQRGGPGAAGARRHRARGGAPWWRLLRCRAAGRAVAAPRLVRGCAAAAGLAMARVCFESHNSRLA